jgi:hypothetical protein
MRLRKSFVTNLKLCLAVLLISSLIDFSFFIRWPGNPDSDVHHSVFAAENFVATGKLRSINLYPERTDDLAAHTQLKWMTQWPLVLSWLSCRWSLGFRRARQQKS